MLNPLKNNPLSKMKKVFNTIMIIYIIGMSAYCIYMLIQMHNLKII